MTAAVEFIYERDLGPWRDYVDRVRAELAADKEAEERFLDESCQDWLAVSFVSPFQP